MSLSRAFQKQSAETLREHARRLARAAATLPVGDAWWRPHEECISFGNILLHLEGNVRQWILAGVGDACDHRQRRREFAAQAGEELVLLAELGATVDEACCLIEELAPESLTEKRRIQGFETTVLGAILHVVEHFSWHTGQAVWIAKARAGVGHGLAFYADEELNQAGE